MSIKISQFPQVGEEAFTDSIDSLRSGVNVTTNPALDLPLLTAGENIAIGAAICEIGGFYFNAINNTPSKTKVVGFSTTTVTSGNNVYGKRYGHITPLSIDGSNSIDDVMYLSGTAGKLTKIQPSGSDASVTVGILTRITSTLDMMIEIYPGVQTNTILNNITTNIVSKTANYSMSITDNIIYMNCNGGNKVITLLASSGFSINNLTYEFIKTDSSSNDLILQTQGSDIIIGGTTPTTYTTNVQDRTISVLADYSNLNWRIK